LSLSLLALLLLVYSSHKSPNRSEKPGGIVSITFDDGSKSQYENGLRLSSQYGIKGTIFLNTKHIGDDWRMGWDDVAAFHAAGWEIASHGYTHPHLTELSENMVIAELDQAIADIEEKIGITPVSFAAPFGDFNAAVLDLIDERYAYNMRAWSENNGRNPIDGVDALMIERLSIEQDTDPVFVCEQMEKAAQNNEWLVLMVHEVVEGEPSEYQVSTVVFEEVLACARELADQSLIQLKTISEWWGEAVSSKPFSLGISI